MPPAHSRLLAWSLVLCGCGALAGQRSAAPVNYSASECACAGGERHDGPPSDYRWYHRDFPTSNNPICPGPTYFESSFLQLSTPREVPWQFTSVCFAVATGEEAAYSARGHVELYDVYPDPAFRSVTVGDRLASVPFEITVHPLGDDGAPVWTTVDLMASKPAVLIGFHLFSCHGWGIAASEGRGQPGRVTFSGNHNDWVLSSSDQTFGAVRALAIRSTGRRLAGAPDDWVCDPRRYANGTGCDCECGTWDPDCGADPHSDRCPDRSTTCDVRGRCVRTGWEASGACDPRSYGTSDGCQCGCGGLTDPDCYDPFHELRGCAGLKSPMCELAGGNCTERWACSPKLFGDGTVCNCGCGAPDPDCQEPRLPNTCADNFTCFEGRCLAPAGWTCSPSYYNAGDDCDCECGMYDPDCDRAGAQVRCSDPTFMCDGGFACDKCNCLPGYKSRTPPRNDCVPICGDNKVVPGEQCDGGVFCSDCRCTAGHSAYDPLQLSCIGCGNGIIDGDEQCDAGDGCGPNCSCLPGFDATTPVTPLCLARGEQSKRKVIIGSTVGGGAGLILLCLCAFFAVYAIRAKKAPRKLNMPIELNNDNEVAGTFVPASCGDTASSSGSLHFCGAESMDPPPLGAIAAPELDMAFASGSLPTLVVNGSSGSDGSSDAFTAQALGMQFAVVPPSCTPPLGQQPISDPCVSPEPEALRQPPLNAP
eukprot:m51a1_g8457 putative serine-threonine protein (704) ;mRNA; r:418450-421184